MATSERSRHRMAQAATPLLLAILLVSGGMILGSVGWVRRTPHVGDPADTTPVAVLTGAELAEAPLDGRTTSPLASSPEPASAEASTTARDFLASYYGARWPDVRAKMESAGAPLDQPYTFHPWEEVAPVFETLVPMNDAQRASSARTLVRWPDELTDEWLQENVPFDRRFETAEEDRVALEVLVEDVNGTLRVLADEYVQRMDGYLKERWRTGNYLKGPFTTVGLGDEMGFCSVSHGSHGWGVTITLKLDDCPDIESIETEAAALRDERDKRVQDYLLRNCAR